MSSWDLTFTAVSKVINRLLDFIKNISILCLKVSIILKQQHNIMCYIHSGKKFAESIALLIILHPPYHSLSFKCNLNQHNNVTNLLKLCSLMESHRILWNMEDVFISYFVLLWKSRIYHLPITSWPISPNKGNCRTKKDKYFELVSHILKRRLSLIWRTER